MSSSVHYQTIREREEWLKTARKLGDPEVAKSCFDCCTPQTTQDKVKLAWVITCTASGGGIGGSISLGMGIPVGAIIGLLVGCSTAIGTDAIIEKIKKKIGENGEKVNALCDNEINTENSPLVQSDNA